MVNVEQKPRWTPVSDMVTVGTIGGLLVDNIPTLAERLRPQTTFQQPLKSLSKGSKSSTLAMLKERNMVTVGNILQLPDGELATFTVAPKLRSKLDNYLTGLLIPPQSRLLQAVFGRLQSPVDPGREQEIVEGVEDILNKMPHKQRVSVLTVRFGLHDGISRTLQETGIKLREKPLGREDIRQLEGKGLRVLSNSPYSEQAKLYLVLPEVSFGRLAFGAVLVKDLPELDETARIGALRLPTNILNELDTKTSILKIYPLTTVEDLVMEDLAKDQAQQLSGRTKSEIVRALHRRVAEIADRRRKEDELQAQREAERLVRLGEPKNNLISEINLTPQQLESLDHIAIKDLKLSTRPFNALKNGDIQTVGELLRKDRLVLLAIRDMGEKSVAEVLVKIVRLLKSDYNVRTS